MPAIRRFDADVVDQRSVNLRINRRRPEAKALEAVVHGDRGSCRIADRRIEEIDLPDGAIIGAVVRGDEVIMAHHDTHIKAGDHVIVFVSDKKLLPRVEKLFQVGAGFL